MPFLGRATLHDVIRRTWTKGSIPQTAKDIIQVAREGDQGQHVGEASRNGNELADSLPFDIAVVQLALQMLSALHYAYLNGVLHRDLKPSNVLLTPSGNPMIMDFDASVDVLDRAVNIAGTIPYMAPECLSCCITHGATDTYGASTPLNLISRDSFPSYDQRSDIFSFGVILYELLTGLLPFGAASKHLNVSERAVVILSRQHRSPLRRNDRNRHVPEELFHIIDQCLAPTMEQRPATFEAVTQRLLTYLSLRGYDDRTSTHHRRRFLKSVLSIGAGASTVAGAVLYGALREQDPWQSGVTAYERGDFQGAIAHFSQGTLKSTQLNNDSTESSWSQVKVGIASCRFGLGQSLRKVGRSSDAVTQFEEAIKLLAHPKILVCLAYLLGQGARGMDALAIYDYALQEWAKYVAESHSTENRRMLACVQNNFGYHLIRSRLFMRGDAAFEKANSIFGITDVEREVIWCNRMETAIRRNASGFLGDAALLDRAREMPQCTKSSPYAGLVLYTAARATARADHAAAAQGRSAETTSLLLAAIAEGCPKEVLMENADFAGTLNAINVPPAFFETGRGKPFSLSDLLLSPTESCRL